MCELYVVKNYLNFLVFDAICQKVKEMQKQKKQIILL